MLWVGRGQQCPPCDMLPLLLYDESTTQAPQGPGNPGWGHVPCCATVQPLSVVSGAPPGLCCPWRHLYHTSPPGWDPCSAPPMSTSFKIESKGKKVLGGRGSRGVGGGGVLCRALLCLTSPAQRHREGAQVGVGSQVRGLELNINSLPTSVQACAKGAVPLTGL